MPKVMNKVYSVNDKLNYYFFRSYTLAFCSPIGENETFSLSLYTVLYVDKVG